MYYTPAATSGAAPNTGTMNLTVSSTGAVTGTAVSTTNVTATLTGTVLNTGAATISSNALNGGNGQFSAANAPTVEVVLSQTVGNTFVILVKNPTAPPSGGNPYAGDYAGTIVNQTKGASGIIAWAIDVHGNISGANFTDVNSFATFATSVGTVQSSGAFTETVTVAGTGSTTTGTLSLVGGTPAVLNGTATNSIGDALTITMNQLQ
jgi:hypothetical protein